jgi:putative peptidoglycan lipid II flippase
LQLVIQLPGLVQAKMQYRPTFSLFHPGMREIIRLMIPRLINAAMLYVSVFINRSLLYLLPNNDGKTYGYVTAFTLVMLPIGVFGMAVSQASFPTMAAFVAAGEWQRLRQTIMRTVRGVTYLAVPASLGMIMLADPLSRLLLAHGHFDLSRLALVSIPLIYFATGLLGLSLVEILVRSFYALHDTRTAVEVSILQFMFVIGLSVLLLDPMGAGGLALATALGSTGEAAVLLLLLRGRLGGLNLGAFSRFFVYVVAASAIAALTAWVVYTAGDYVLHIDTQTAFPLFSRQTGDLAIRLLAAILAASGMYYGFSRVLGISDTVPIERIARRLLRR